MKNKKLKRGQIVVFMVLIFQMLFVFISMMVNIGLVVHDKINLQNAVDLSAIYGAQRQAEILNALAHINYQIRQSYKLMAWRYFILGNLGANYSTDYRITDTGPDSNNINCPGLLRSGRRGPSGSNKAIAENINQCPYAVCMRHPYWDIPTSGSDSVTDHACRNLTIGSLNISRPSTTFPAGSLNALTIGASVYQDILDRSDESFDRSCQGMQKVNWFMAASILYLFQYDQWKRKLLAINLFDRLLKQNKDIEGNNIEEGVKKTLQNNLTFVNYINLTENPSSFQMRTSIGARSFDSYFEWKKITPILFYTYLTTDIGNICKSDILPIQKTPNVSSFNPPLHLLQFLQNNPSALPSDLTHLSSGFYKKISDPPPDIAVRVTAEIPYSRQIFFPMRTIILKAQAYAKPFGSGFGPPPTADSLLPQQASPLPVQSVNNSLLNPSGQFEPFLRYAPNHSLYPEDTQGLYNHGVQYAWVSRLFAGGLGISTPPQNFGYKFINYYANMVQPDPMVLNLQCISGSCQPDNNFFNIKILEMEEQAIAPDLFDLTYYTILPNYMTTLYRKINSNTAFKQALQSAMQGLPDIPGDLGFFNTTIFGLNDFYQLSQNRGGCYTSSSPFRLNFIQKQIECVNQNSLLANLTYKVRNTNHLLTSWSPPEQGGYTPGPMYRLNSSKFGQCDKNDNNIQLENPSSLHSACISGDYPCNQNLIPQHCLEGGRSGFSVKLIHKEIGEPLF